MICTCMRICNTHTGVLGMAEMCLGARAKTRVQGSLRQGFGIPVKHCSGRRKTPVSKTYMYMCVDIYIYIYRERERCICMYIYIYIIDRDRERDAHTHTHTHTHTHIYIYIYTCIHTRMSACICIHTHTMHAYIHTVGFHNFNLRSFNLRMSNPNKLIVDVFVDTMSDFNVPGSRPKTT